MAPPASPAPSQQTVYVLDSTMGIARIGVSGELFVAGVGVARGYLADPASTATRFVPDPHGAEPGARLYRTGDIGRYRPDGAIEFLGRVDEQIKIRGYRIEVAEVEAALQRTGLVREAVVVGRRFAAGDLRLVAYVVAATKGVTEEELRLSIAATCPAYMVPAAIVIVDELPRSPGGKVDRRALPAPSVPQQLSVEPRDDLELAVSTLWQDVLGSSSVGVTDDFFALGGHSLLAVRLLGDVESASAYAANEFVL